MSPLTKDYELSDDDRRDLADAYDQDKELRWLERDRARAQAQLLGADSEIDDETLRTLQVEFTQCRDRLEKAKKEILERLMPQFAARSRARANGGNAVVFTPSEERTLTLPERHELMTGTRRNTLAFELKAIAQDRLRRHGWNPEAAEERRQADAEVVPDSMPLPSLRQWKVYATVAVALGLES